MIDTIILAAGNGARLKGTVPTGLKPLLVVNGESLIGRLVTQVRKATGKYRIVVVASPTNIAPIVDLLGKRLDYVIQPEPAGPGEALLRGLAVVRDAERVLVLAGDNYLDDRAIPAVLAADRPLTVGVRVITDAAIARRFTRVREYEDVGGSGFLDIPRARLDTEEGPELHWAGPWTVWCGPLVVPTVATRTLLTRLDVGDISLKELKIGAYLGELDCSSALVPVEAQDIGVPEALP